MTTKTPKRYGLFILATLSTVALLMGLGDWLRNRALEQSLEILNTPWAWHGVMCHSEIRLHDMDRFNIDILHPPGRDRAVVDAAIQQLPEQNGTIDDTPYASERLEKYMILSTECLDSWESVYRHWDWFRRGAIHAHLPADGSYTEADWRRAILQAKFPQHFEAADRLFPLTPAIVSSTLEETSP